MMMRMTKGFEKGEAKKIDLNDYGKVVERVD